MLSVQDFRYLDAIRLPSGRLVNNVYMFFSDVRIAKIYLINERINKMIEHSVNDRIYKYIYTKQECLFLVQSFYMQADQLRIYTYMPDNVSLEVSQYENCLEISLSR